MAQEESFGAMYSLGDQFNSNSVSAVDLGSQDTYFVISGRSNEGNSELHIVQYKQEYSSVACQQIYETPSQIEKVIFDDKKTKNIFTLASVGEGKTIVSKLSRDVITTKDIESREECFKLNKESRNSKNSIDESNSLKIDFAATGMVFSYQDTILALNSTNQVSLYDTEAGKETQKWTDLGEEIFTIAADEHMNRLAVANGNDVQLLDMRTSSDDKILNLPNCHEEDISSLDFNCNKNHTMLTSSYDQSIKVWDIRKPDFPMLVIQDPDSQIESAKFNPAHDQLILYSSSSGSTALYLANSVSSSLKIDIDAEESSDQDYLITKNLGCLGDSVMEVAWNFNSPWTYGGVCYGSSAYFDVVPESEKDKILL